MILPYKQGSVRVTSPYGMRTLNGVRGMHKGIDLVGAYTTIVAPCSGKIGWAGMVDDAAAGGRTHEWGNYIRIETDDGYAVYLCHLAAYSVRAGQLVSAGDVIGMEGSTGKVTGRHLHFEVRKGGKSVNPAPLLGIVNQAGVYPVPVIDCAELVCKKAGLEAQTKAYLDKYRFADDLWRKLWEAMQ